MYKYEEAFNRLPERFRKPNNEKLYYVLYGYSFDEMEEALEGVESSRDIKRATGKSLDYLGANVGEFRRGQDDERYRLLIQTRILANLSMGDIPTINKIMSILFEKNYLGIEEGYLDNLFLYKESASIKLYMDGDSPDLPYDTLDRIRAAAIRVMIEYVFKKQVKIKNSVGLDSYKVWLCGEHPCGDIPYTYVIGQGAYIDLKAKSGLYNSENYYGYAPKGGLIIMRDDKNREFRYVQDMSSDRCINFGGKDD